MKKYYVVKVGYNPGYYTNFADAQLQIQGYSGAQWRGFNNRQDAIDYYEGRAPAKAKSPAKRAAPQTAFIGGIQVVESQPQAKHQVQSCRVQAELDAKTKELAQVKKKLEEKTEAFAATHAELERKNLDLFVVKRELKQALSFMELDVQCTKLWYVYEDSIYDDWKYVQEDGCKPDSVSTVYTFKEALTQIKRRSHSRYTSKFRQDLHHATDLGQTVYEIYTDGACSRNGKPGAAAGIGLYYGPYNRMNLSEPLPGSIQTNQRAELAAILRAYMSIVKMKNGMRYKIYTDSAYAIDCVTKWYKTWRNNGWRNSNGCAVSNRDLIEKILDLKEATICASVSLEKVEAHGSNEGNNMADKLAREGVLKHGSHRAS